MGSQHVNGLTVSRWWDPETSMFRTFHNTSAVYQAGDLVFEDHNFRCLVHRDNLDSLPKWARAYLKYELTAEGHKPYDVWPS